MPSPSDSLYAKEWAAIDSLDKQGLPQSALDLVNQLYLKADNEQKPAQVLKTLIYRAKYSSQLQDDGESAVINEFRKEVVNAPFPRRAILHSLLGQLYQQYLERNSYRFQGRTQTEQELDEDFRTWSLARIQKTAARNYLASVENEDLKKIPVSDYDAVLIPGYTAGDLRPTLYDLLAHRAIDYFTDSRSFLSEPAYAFALNQEAAFGDLETFINYDFPDRDSSSMTLQATLLLQRLLQYRQTAGDQSALIDLDLKRLDFARNESGHPQKDTLYHQALLRLQKKYQDEAGVAPIYYKLALLHYSRANQYAPLESDDFKWEKKKAWTLCKEAVKRFPKSYTADQCRQLINTIEKPTLGIEIESVIVPERPALVKVNYSSLKQAYFRIVRFTEQQMEAYDNTNPYEKRVEYLLQLPVVRQWTQKLPIDGDYNEHSTELLLKALPAGTYALLFSDQSTFKYRKERPFSIFFFRASAISYFNRRNTDNQTEFVVMDRYSGAPLADVELTFFSSEYDRNKRQYVKKESGRTRTDKNGFATALADDASFSVRFQTGEDIFFSDDQFYNGRTAPTPPARLITHLFLDRAIYRPGQTIYFKGVVLRSQTKEQPQIAPAQQVTVRLMDPNYQVVKEATYRTNDFGTFNGVFQAPTTGLLGRMTIEVEQSGRAGLRVEEYKRPKFQVNLDPVDGDFALNDQVEVRGVAKAFSGSAIDGALVNYRVVRSVNYPYLPWLRSWYSYAMLREPDAEITSGTSTTDAEGKFSIPFQALPDQSIPKDRNPQFVYKVTVDVVDITGETQSSSRQITIGYTGLKAEIAAPKESDLADKQIHLQLRIQNLNGENITAEGKLQIFRLQSPDRPMIDRFWSLPDIYTLKQKEFEAAFPDYAYKGTNSPFQWERGGRLQDIAFNTAQSDTLNVSTTDWSTGHYLVLLQTKDKAGNPVEDRKIISVYDTEKQQIPADQKSRFQLDKSSYEPGETAQLTLAGSYSPLHVLVETEKQGEIINSRWMELKNWTALTEQVEETDRGNFYIHLSFVKANRPETEKLKVTVPWSNKELRFEYSTFRDKLRPGQEEEWIIKVLGPKKETVAAEMVATMYDQSLDQFVAHNWWFNLYSSNGSYINWRSPHFDKVDGRLYIPGTRIESGSEGPVYPEINWFGLFYRGYPELYANKAYFSAYSERADEGAGIAKMAPRSLTPPAPPPPPGAPEAEESMATDPEMDSTESLPSEAQSEQEPPAPLQIRKDLSETVFFLPELYTDEDGNVLIKFKMKEALTQWKFMAMAHTKDLKTGITTREIVTQKELMVQPNAPRFVRETDAFEFTAKVSNMTEQKLSGTAKLELLDAASLQPVHQLLGLDTLEQAFTADAKQSARLAWNIRIPKGQLSGLTYRVIAQADDFSDGEENTLPVLSNRMLVTESMPLSVRANQTVSFDFTALREKSTSPTLEHQSYTLEYTTNPAWLAVKSLPYLMEYPHECSEQIFSRYYANSLAASIVNRHPKIKAIFDSWNTPDALKSKLYANQELKAVILEETPWVLEAQSESEQQKNLAILFDLNRMADEQLSAIQKLAERQMPSGGFSWFPGGQENWYITVHMLSGFGHLDDLGAEANIGRDLLGSMVGKMITYADEELVKYHQDLLEKAKAGHVDLDKDHLYRQLIHYLYARSFFLGVKPSELTQQAIDYYLGQGNEYWTKKDLQQQAQLALAAQRFKWPGLTDKIVRSLEERALRSEELGMYWKYGGGYFWYEAPIETHSLMIELFAKAGKKETVDELKIWLLKNKQTNHWETTKATSEAIYALLNTEGGGQLLEQSEPVDIRFEELKKRDYKDKIEAAQAQGEAGTGYFRTCWSGQEVGPELAQMKVKNPNDIVSWGAVYWQYFEDLDKITTFEDTPLKLRKKIFKEVNSEQGPVLRAVDEGSPVQVGDKLIVRIELEVDREMEYVHLKDMRASGLEPLNVLSQYKWQDGLGYYESTKDVATHFFFDFLSKGTYVFEYPLRATLSGNFSNGISTIQSMYAPEFSSHSEGIQLTIKGQ